MTDRTGYLAAAARLWDAAAGAPPLPFAEAEQDRAVLVIVDMVQGFATEGPLSSPRVAALVPEIQRLQARFRAAGLPVLAFADAHSPAAAEFASFPPHCLAGTSESELVPELAAGVDLLIPKNSTNGYLEPALHQSGILEDANAVVVVGDCTDICVLQFALTLKADRNRQNRPVRIIVPVNAVDTFDADFHPGDFLHLAALQIMAGMGVEVVSRVA